MPQAPPVRHRSRGSAGPIACSQSSTVMYDASAAQGGRGAVREATVSAVRDELARAFGGLDVARAREAYWRQNELLVLERWLPPSVVEALAAEVEAVRPAIHRNYIPRHKKGGSVSS